MHVVKELNQVLRTQRSLEARGAGESTPEEIAQLLDKPVQDVRSILQLNEHTASLDAPLDIDPSLSIGESIADDSVESAEDQIQTAEVEHLMAEWISELSDKQRVVIEYRYGLNGVEPQTLEQLADHLGLTRERVRQIQLEALSHLRRIMKRAGVSKDVLF